MASKNRIETEKASIHVQEVHGKIKDHPFRQKFHWEVPAGWCNDPNGFSFYQGKYHLFYQHMPYTATPGDYVMCWGHAVSKDLVEWEDLPVALAPCDEYDGAGCWSGCGLSYDGKMTLMYTGLDARKNKKQVQCLAFSEDGIHFEKYEGNPVLPGALCDDDDANFRDPCIWQHDGTWYMAIGSSKGKFGRVLLYRSEDLKNWTYFNTLVESLGELGSVCECPNFFEIDGKYVLFISPHGLSNRKSLYLVGDFDYQTGKYFWHNMGEIDWGMDYYAPQVLQDEKGRTIAIGWMNSWDWMPWADGVYDTTKLGWCGGMALPRELSLNKDRRLVMKPVCEVESLRKEKREVSGKTLEAGEKLELSAGDNRHCEILFRIDLSRTTAEQIVFETGNGEEYYVKAIFDLKAGELVFDRTHTLSHLKNVRKCCLSSVMSGKLEARIFIDSASIEIFTDDYETSMTNTMYLPEEDRQIRLISVGGEAVLEKAEIWTL